MDRERFGTILADARVRQGIDLSTVSRDLRIRVDILRAIEDSDTERMPPRGYARNMVHAYARYLGLNPSTVTRLYLDDMNEGQLSLARSSQRSTGIEMPTSRTGRVTVNYRDDDSATYDTPQNRYRRTNVDGDTRSTGTRRSLSQGTGARTSYPTYVSTSQMGGMSSRMPFIIAAVIIVILLAVILFLVFGRGSSSDEDVPVVPVTGLSDETAEVVEGEDTQVSVIEVAPTSTTFTYEVAEGDSYIEIYVDDAFKLAETVSGPASGEYEVTGTLEFVTTNPDIVTIYQDGEELELTSPNNNGVYRITISFADVLSAWEEEHGTSSSSDEDTSSADESDESSE